MMQLLDDYFALQAQIYDYFGYFEDWRVIPLDDVRQYFWRLDGEGYGGNVHFADSIEELNSGEGNCYSNEIYTQRHLEKWVYRGEQYTLICVDTHTDGNKFLSVFDNSKEIK